MTGLTPAATSSRARPIIGYGLMIVGVIIVYLFIRAYGNTLSAPAPIAAGGFRDTASAGHAHDLLHVLIALVLVIATARSLGTLFRLIHQPPVVGEIIAGILLGPSLLGRVAPAASAYLLPLSVAPFLNVLAQMGVILYMFLVGLELDPTLLRNRGHTTVAISHASIIAPFLLGTIMALLLYPRLSSSDVPFTSFSLFLGVSMSVTAFPVLARILTDRRIHKTRMGVITLTCAAVDDVTAWCLLAFVVSVASARASGAVATFGMALAYIAVMVFVARPAMARLALAYGNKGRLTPGVMSVVFIAILLSSVATELIGIHAIFGAFALGAMIPHDSGMARELTDRLEDLVVALLLPAFFAFTGLRTQIGLVAGMEQWAICALIIVVASIGKFGGSAIAARLTGLDWRDASALGVLMNTRGLMELIVLNIGLEFGVISPALFAMLVLMALVTTFATTPLLHFIMRGRRMEDEAEAIRQLSRPMLIGAERSAILVPVSNPDGVADLVELALAATPQDAPPPRVLALVRVPGGGIRSGLREAEQRVPPRSPALSAALDLAWSRNAVITPQAVWTADPARDIIRTAAEPQIGWLLLGSHRSVFGSHFKGGVVREILNKTDAMPINVGVVIHGSERLFDQVSAVVDMSRHGRAALDLAARIAQRRRCTLHAILVPRDGAPEAEPALREMLREVASSTMRRMETSVLAEPTAGRLAELAPSGILIVGTDLADKLGIAEDGLADRRRCVVVVQGSRAARAAAASGVELRDSAES
jgi:Kef-type K+ transport system membrane component KefB